MGPTSGLAPGPSPGTSAAPGLSALGPSPLGASLLNDVETKPGSQLGFLSFQSSGKPDAASEIEDDDDDGDSMSEEVSPISTAVAPPPPSTAPPPNPQGAKSTVAKPPGLETPEMAPDDRHADDPPAFELLKESAEADAASDNEGTPEAPPQQFQPGSAASWLNSSTQETEKEEKVEADAKKHEEKAETSVFRADAPAFYPKAMLDTLDLKAALGLPSSSPSDLVRETPSSFLEPEVARPPVPEESFPLPPTEAPPPAPVSVTEDIPHESDGRSAKPESADSDEERKFLPPGGLEDDDTDAPPLPSSSSLGPPMEPPPPAPHSVLASIAAVGLNEIDEGPDLIAVENLRRRCQRFGLPHELPRISFDSDQSHPPEVLRETVLLQRLVIEDLLKLLEGTTSSGRL